jgi:hypothetical protein
MTGASLEAVDGFGTSRLVISGSSVQPPAKIIRATDARIGATVNVDNGDVENSDLENDVFRRGVMVRSLSESVSHAEPLSGFRQAGSDRHFSETASKHSK